LAIWSFLMSGQWSDITWICGGVYAWYIRAHVPLTLCFIYLEEIRIFWHLWQVSIYLMLGHKIAFIRMMEVSTLSLISFPTSLICHFFFWQLVKDSVLLVFLACCHNFK
jgi:hypothetical protein